MKTYTIILLYPYHLSGTEDATYIEIATAPSPEKAAELAKERCAAANELPPGDMNELIVIGGFAGTVDWVL